MLNKETSPEVREGLAATGFVRVDGLTVVDISGKSFEIKRMEPECCRWDGNNGRIAIAINSEIWLGASSNVNAIMRRRSELAKELGLERGLWVPCSNGEKLNGHDILERLADPSWNPKR